MLQCFYARYSWVPFLKREPLHPRFEASAWYIPVSAAIQSFSPVAVCTIRTATHTSDGHVVLDRTGMHKQGMPQKAEPFSTRSPLQQTSRAGVPYVLWSFFSEAGVTIRCVECSWESNPMIPVRTRSLLCQLDSGLSHIFPRQNAGDYRSSAAVLWMKHRVKKTDALLYEFIEGLARGKWKLRANI